MTHERKVKREDPSKNSGTGSKPFCEKDRPCGSLARIIGIFRAKPCFRYKYMCTRTQFTVICARVWAFQRLHFPALFDGGLSPKRHKQTNKSPCQGSLSVFFCVFKWIVPFFFLHRQAVRSNRGVL